MVRDITDSEFEQEVINSNQPVIVDFWAEWCGPCKMLSPTIADLANDMPETKVVKVNIEENPDTPQKYGVRGIPTIMVFKNGEVVATKVGALPKQTLYEWVKSSI